jgi:hypothetical protein
MLTQAGVLVIFVIPVRFSSVVIFLYVSPRSYDNLQTIIEAVSLETISNSDDFLIFCDVK